MNKFFDHKHSVEEEWLRMLQTGEIEKEERQRRFMKFLPGTPRCKFCLAPFSGIGASIAWSLFHRRPSNINPYFCTACEEFAREHPGGAEVELSLLFADIRGSTEIAASLSTRDYGDLIGRFYSVATDVLAKSDAMIDKIIGDQASGIFVPGIAGEDHSTKAIEAGIKLLQATGNVAGKEPWVPLGIGVHTGRAFVGALGDTKGVLDMTVLGDVANTAARLSTSAGVGELLITDASADHANYDLLGLEKRHLKLKGKQEKIAVNVLSL
jgi:adenylate cyclase